MSKKRKTDQKKEFDQSSYKTPSRTDEGDSYDNTSSGLVSQSGAKRSNSESLEKLSQKQTKKQKKDTKSTQEKFTKLIDIEGENLEYLQAQTRDRLKSLEKALSKISKVKSQVTVNARIEQLEAHNYEVTPVRGDGNCLFRAVAHSLYGNDTNYHEIRNDAVAYMRANPASFRPFMEDNQNLEGYLRHMSSDRAWGGNQEIIAIANTYNLQIVVFGISFIQVITPSNYTGDREMQTIGLLHHINHFWAVGDAQDEFRIPTIQELPPLTAVGEPVTSSDRSSAETMDLTGDGEVPTRVLSKEELRTISDHVSEALNQAGYKVEKVLGDGNCLFRAFAKALAAANQLHEKDAPDHETLRHLATERLRNDDKDLYKKFLNDDQSLDEAIVKLSRFGEYAGNLAFQLLADIFGVNIFVVGGTSNFTISTTAPNTAINLIIFYNGIDHFDAVIPENYDNLFTIFQEETSNSGTPIDQTSVTKASKESDDDPVSDIWRLFEEYKEENTALQNQVENYDKFIDVGMGVSTFVLMLGIALSYTS